MSQGSIRAERSLSFSVFQNSYSCNIGLVPREWPVLWDRGPVEVSLYLGILTHTPLSGLIPPYTLVLLHRLFTYKAPVPETKTQKIRWFILIEIQKRLLFLLCSSKHLWSFHHMFYLLPSGGSRRDGVRSIDEDHRYRKVWKKNTPVCHELLSSNPNNSQILHVHDTIYEDGLKCVT